MIHAGPMKGLAFIQDPDGYWIEILSADNLAKYCGKKDHWPGADLAFFQGGGGGVWPNDDAEHRPRGEPIFFGYFEPP